MGIERVSIWYIDKKKGTEGAPKNLLKKPAPTDLVKVSQGVREINSNPRDDRRDGHCEAGSVCSKGTEKLLIRGMKSFSGASRLRSVDGSHDPPYRDFGPSDRDLDPPHRDFDLSHHDFDSPDASHGPAHHDFGCVAL